MVVNALVVVALVSVWWCSTVHLMHLMLLVRQQPPWRDRWPGMENLTRTLGAGWWWVYAAGTAAMVVVLLRQAAAGTLPPAFATAALVTFWAATAATWPYVSKREREGTV